ncbi:MAG: hypothetical protein V1933_02845, partial [Candidatus Omnitrophota bacterium]
MPLLLTDRIIFRPKYAQAHCNINFILFERGHWRVENYGYACLSARLSAKPRADRPASACAFRLTASVRAQAGTQTGVGLP